MIELRQRPRSRSGQSYTRVNTEEEDDFSRPRHLRTSSLEDDDDDDDFIPTPNYKRMKFVPQTQSRVCKFLVSLVVLFFISYLIHLS
jgi:hypothetical protein